VYAFIWERLRFPGETSDKLSRQIPGGRSIGLAVGSLEKPPRGRAFVNLKSLDTSTDAFGSCGEGETDRWQPNSD
jgi:hypothetical protein